MIKGKRSVWRCFLTAKGLLAVLDCHYMYYVRAVNIAFRVLFDLVLYLSHSAIVVV